MAHKMIPALAALTIGLSFSATATARETIARVDSSYHIDVPVPHSARAQCSSALDSLSRDVKAGRHRLYKLAWQIPGQHQREDAAEVVHGIKITPSKARLQAASRCCSRMSDTRSIPNMSGFTCLSSALR